MPARVTRFGIAIPGPGAAAALCLEYVENGKERVRVVKLSVKDIGLETGALVEPTLRALPSSVDLSSISQSQVSALLARLAALHEDGTAVPEASAPPPVDDEVLSLSGDRLGEVDDAEVDAYVIQGDRDLNKVTDHELAVAKAKMDAEFLRKRVTPGDTGFVYDRRVDFEPVASDAGSWESSFDGEPRGRGTATAPREGGKAEGVAAAGGVGSQSGGARSPAGAVGVVPESRGGPEREGPASVPVPRPLPAVPATASAAGAVGDESFELDESVEEASMSAESTGRRAAAAPGAGAPGVPAGGAREAGMTAADFGIEDDMAIRGGDSLDDLDDYDEDFDGGEGDRIGVEMLPGNDFGVDELDELPDLPDEYEERLDSDIGMSSLERWERNI